MSISLLLLIVLIIAVVVILFGGLDRLSVTPPVKNVLVIVCVLVALVLVFNLVGDGGFRHFRFFRD